MANENVIALRLALSGVTQVQNGLKAVAGTLGALVAANVSVGNLVRLTGAAIKAADEMGKLAQKSGIAVESLSSLSFAAKLNDVEQTELNTAFKELSKTMVEQGRETESLETRLMELSDVFASMPDGPQKAKLALDNFGRAGLQLIPFLNQGSEAIRKQRREAEDFGLIISDRFAQNADQFNDNLFRIKSSLQGLFLQIADRILPTLIELQEKFLEFTKSIENREATIAGMVELFKQATMFGAGLAQAFEQVAIFAQRMANAVSGNQAPWQDFERQAAESWQRFERLIQTLDRIGEEIDDNADSQNRANGPLREYVALASKLQTLQSMSKQIGFFAGEIAATEKGAESRKRQVAALTEQLRLLKEIEKQPELNGAQLVNGGLYSEKSIGIIQRQLELKKEQLEIETKIRELNSQSNFSDRLRSNIETMTESFGTVSTQIADTITNTIGTAINSISSNITQLIIGTQNWGQTLRNIGLTVITEVIQSIIKMGVQFVLQHTIMRGAMAATNAVGTALGWKSVAQTNAQEAAKAPALATNAASASIGSYGAAAVIGGIAAVAALGLILAAALGSFAEGGYTGNGGRYQVAGVAHKGEYIFSAPDVGRIGIGNIEAFRNGDVPASSPAVQQSRPQITNIIATDENHVRQLLRSRAGREEVLNIVRLGKIELGLS